MDLSGVIFVVLALVWAAYLLPKALRHHDEVARTRSVDEVSDQARVVVTAPTVDSRRAGRVRRTRAAAAERRAALSPAGRAARRRRRILALLLVACLVTGVAAVVAVLPVWAPAVPGGLLLGFLVLCRVLVRRDHARRLAARPPTTQVAPARPAGQQVQQPVEPVQPVQQPVKEPALTAPTPSPAVDTAPVGSLDDTDTFHALLVDDIPGQRSDATAAAAPAGSLWDPLPVTLPTYVGKQRAMRSVRTISLGDPGVSSSGRDAADSALVAGASAPKGQPGDGNQRVVGG